MARGTRRKTKSYPRDTLTQAESVKQGWHEVGEKLFVPRLNVKRFESLLEQAKESAARAEELKKERAKAIEDRNALLCELWDMTKRVRNAAKATFGDYSAELQLLLNFHEDPEQEEEPSERKKQD